MDGQERSLTLRSGYALVADEAGPDTVELRAPDGRVCLKITLSPEGPQVELSAAALSLVTRGDVAVDCERFRVNARDEVSLAAGGALETTAFSQRHESLRGDLALVANDDVTLDGERILLNRPKVLPPMRPEDGDGDA